MAKKNKNIDASPLKDAASNLLKETLGYIKNLKNAEGDIKYFPGGIELIEISVEYGSAKVSLKVAGHEPTKEEGGN